MGTKKSEAMKFLERLAGGPLTLGGLLESIRLGDEISQAAFARQLGISRQNLCDIEKGRSAVSPERAWRWGKELGYSEHQFVELALQDRLNAAKIPIQVTVTARRSTKKRGTSAA